MAALDPPARGVRQRVKSPDRQGRAIHPRASRPACTPEIAWPPWPGGLAGVIEISRFTSSRIVSESAEQQRE
jgi:hypothetical protein